MPAAAHLAAEPPDPSDRVATGRYLTAIAGCADCHTPLDSRQRPLAGKRLAGGQEFPLPNGLIARSANLTPDATGIGNWTEDAFVAAFAAYRDAAAHRPVGLSEFNTPMPWQSYAGMTRDDLSSIFAYLKTVPPVSQVVEKVGRQVTGTHQ